MYILLELLIDMLNTIGLVFDLESSFLGFTVIAIGNALPDALNTIAFSKQGQAILAISGAYNGQLFGLLIGFGLGTLKNYLKTKTAQPFKIFDTTRIGNNFVGIMVILTMLVTLVFTFVWAVLNKF
jgi:solute carrier family 24 (sodium/potassium/calcium exchanger), member 6